MKTLTGIKMGLLAASSMALLGLAGCDNPKPGETAGKKIDQAMDKMGQKVDQVAERAKEQGEKAGQAMDDTKITAAVKAGILTEPGLKVLKIDVDTKDGFATAGRIVSVQRNAAPITLDMTGGWGGAARTALKASEVDAHGIVFSEGSTNVEPNSRTIPFANMRAEIYWMFRIALDPKSGENIELPPGAKILAEGSAPRWKMQGGKLYIESKEQIRERLGSSTDIFDAIVIAWHNRAKGIVKRQQKAGLRPTAQMQSAESDPYAIDGF